MDNKEYLLAMKRKYPLSPLLLELVITDGKFEMRDCCTEVVSLLNEEQLNNIVNNVKMLEDEGFFEIETV